MIPPLPRWTRAARRLLRAALPRRSRPAILMYHRIAEESFDPWGITVHPRFFEVQMDWLARNRTVLPLTEFARLHRQSRLPGDAVALTFDDGYACNREVALPLLDRLSLPSTIFISPELVERGGEFWWDELERLVLGHDGEGLRLGGVEIPLGEREERDREWRSGDEPSTERQRAYRRLWTILHSRGRTELSSGMDELRAQASATAEVQEARRLMTAREISEIAGSAVDFGSHGLTHASLLGLSATEKAREIADSIARCEALTGSRPSAFAYPFGDHDPQSRQIAEEAGFACACTTRGHYVARDDDPFALPRIAVGDWDEAAFARLLG